MKCLVTGATGFLGTNLVHELVRAGWEVRASGLPGDSVKYIENLPIEIKLADITKAEEADAIVEGCEIVFNVAGDTSFWRHFYARQRAVNVDGALNIARACLRHGVRRMVHTSTMDVLGYVPGGGSITEATADFNYTGMGYNYGETKFEADQRLRELIAEGLDVVFIYPGTIIGPFDHTLQEGRLFFELKEGKLPGLIPGGASFCHATEVARAHIAAAERGRKGEGYICAGDDKTNIPHAELWRRMADAVGAKAPRITMPRWAFMAYAYLCQFAAEFTRKPPEIDPGQARYMATYQYGQSDKAKAELGYRVPPIKQCIADALAWYRANGFEI